VPNLPIGRQESRLLLHCLTSKPVKNLRKQRQINDTSLLYFSVLLLACKSKRIFAGQQVYSNAKFADP